MSNNVFPSLPGLKWNQSKTPIFSTLIQRSISGKEVRIPLYVYPLYQFDLSYELLRDTGKNELKQLMGFYLQRQGASDDFLYVDPSDNHALNENIATGDGNNNTFQFIRSYGGFTEPRLDIQSNNNSVPLVIRINGNAQNANNYTMNYLANGTVTFNATPSNGANISADFAYYYRVRFIEYTEGENSFSQFMKDLWELQTLSFISVKQASNIYLPV